MQERSGWPQSNCTGVLELATWAAHACLLSLSPSLFSFGLSRHVASEPSPSQMVSGDILAQCPKIPNWYLVMIQANTHTYVINIWRADSGGRLWNWSPVDYLVSFVFPMRPVQMAFILQRDWIKMVGCGMGVFIFSNDFTYLQLFLSITLANSFYKFYKTHIVNDCCVCASESEFTNLYCYWKICKLMLRISLITRKRP